MITNRKYEGLFLIDSATAAKDWNAVVEHITALLTKHKAEVLQTVRWAERKLAFEVKLGGQYLKRGTYVLAFFNSSTEATMKMRKDVGLSDTIARALFVRHEGDMRIPPGPTDADRVGRTDFGGGRGR